MSEPEKLKAGNTTGIYRVIKADYFGRLPLAVIKPGNVNEGVQVILTSPYRK